MSACQCNKYFSYWCLCNNCVFCLHVVVAQKFVAVDEATVMQEIIDERDVEIKKVLLFYCAQVLDKMKSAVS